MQRAGMIERGGVDRPEILRVYECACGGFHVGNVAPSTLGEAATA